MNPPVVLTIAGSDSGGAAGVAADLATIAALGAHGACVLTAVTAQDTTAVHAVHQLPVEVVDAQLGAVLDDLPVAAVKTGMLGAAAVVRLVAKRIDRLRSDAGSPALVVDPVLVATSGAVLGDGDVGSAYREWLLPVADVLTPNLDEARALLGYDDHPAALAEALAALGPSVVLTGGAPTSGPGSTCTDWLAVPRRPAVPLRHATIDTTNDHGTGCTFSAALAVHLANGLPLRPAVERAGQFTSHQLRVGRDWTLGRGRGPIAHIHQPQKEEL